MEMQRSSEIQSAIPYISEEKALKEVKKLIAGGVKVEKVVQGLAGLESAEAWEIRDQFVQEMNSRMIVNYDRYSADTFHSFAPNEIMRNGLFARGLAGLDSDRAWEQRERLLRGGAEPYLIVMGLSGLNNDRAWKLRDKIMEIRNPIENVDAVIHGLIGLDTDRAWKMRKQAQEYPLFNKINKHWLARGLAGLDSDQAWEMRYALLQEGADKGYIAMGLIGLDNDRAWKMREQLLKDGADKGFFAKGLAGLDSDRAWEIREQLLKEGAHKGFVAKGLAGLDSDRAWAMRERLLAEGADKDYVAEGINGNHLTFVWKLLQKKKLQTGKAESLALQTSQHVAAQI